MASWSRRAVSRHLFGLAPTGVYPAVTIAGYAVSSYLTISPLPAERRRFVFCGTIRHHASGAQALPGDLPFGARTFLDEVHPSRLSDHPHPRTRSISEMCTDATCTDAALTAGLTVRVSSSGIRRTTPVSSPYASFGIHAFTAPDTCCYHADSNGAISR